MGSIVKTKRDDIMEESRTALILLNLALIIGYAVYTYGRYRARQ